MKIMNIYSELFRAYGKVIDLTEISKEGRLTVINYLKNKTSAPREGNIYVVNEPSIQKMAVSEEIKAVLSYNKVQFGYCHGNSTKVNALEWHNCEELVLAVTDCALYLGHPDNLNGEDGRITFDTSHLVAIQLSEGEMVRLNPKIMHFAPIKVNHQPYKTLIVLEKGTNEPLNEMGENNLFMTNKWMITHNDRQDLVQKGVLPGLIGENYDWADR